ncbi:MAG: hypothetical protein ACRDWD_15900 [Acidimicrobiia bacterium]
MLPTPAPGDTDPRERDLRASTRVDPPPATKELDIELYEHVLARFWT